MNTKKIILATLVAVCGATTSMASFGQEKTPGSGPNPYADCGIGAALFSETKWAAVVSNVIWDLGATALISATASPQTCSGKNVQAALFIRDTYGQLTEETAAGRGEHLTTALNLFGCSAGQHAAATHDVRGAMGRTVATPGYANRPALDQAAAFFTIMDSAARTRCEA